jgi:hypothetical protein
VISFRLYLLLNVKIRGIFERKFHKPVLRDAININVWNAFTYTESVTDGRIPACPSLPQRFHWKYLAMYLTACRASTRCK